MQTKTTLMKSLAAIIIIAFSIWAVTDADKVRPCCVAVSRSMENITITGYRLQKKNLPCIKAVIFQTELGQFCIDPHQPWVKKMITEFRNSEKNKRSTTHVPMHRTSSASQTSAISTQMEKKNTMANFSE